jgi:uncharacterized ion transporter superfamily protein YfcC
MDMARKRSRRFTVPSPYAVLGAVIVVAAIATWLLPAGRYERVSYEEAGNVLVVESPTGTVTLPAEQSVLDSLGVRIGLEKFTSGGIRRPVAIPGTYREEGKAEQGAIAVLQAPIRGLYDAVDVVLFVLVIGGFIEVFSRSGAFEAGIGILVRRFEGREAWLIVILTMLFAAGGTIYGMSEETVAFYPLLVPIFLAAGYDVIVPLAVIFVGAGMGFMASTVNPFATIIASEAAGVSWTVGLVGRLLMLAVGVGVCTAYILRYASRVKADPTTSLVWGVVDPATVPAAASRPGTGATSLDPRSTLLLGLFALTFAVMVLGVSRLGWWFTEMTTLFLVSAIVVGIIAGGGEKAFMATFVKGAENLLGVALIIGIARGVTVVLDDGQISGTLLYYSSQAVSGMPRSVFIVALMLVFAGLTLFISSSSGMAVLTMPIMGSLAAVVGVPSEQIVNAYLYGFGLMSFLAPTGMVLPSLAMVDVPYSTFIRFVTPLMLILGVISAAFLVVGVLA